MGDRDSDSTGSMQQHSITFTGDRETAQHGPRAAMIGDRARPGPGPDPALFTARKGGRNLAGK
jgi:hypothetical protein